MVAADNDVFDCLVPTIFHYAYNAYVIPAEGKMYWCPEGSGTDRVASMDVQVVNDAATRGKKTENGQLVRALVGALRA